MADSTPNSTTIPPIKCPILTHSGYDADSEQFFCDYASWAYGIFAIVAILAIMVPLVSTICCITRFKARRRYIRRMRSTISSGSLATSSEQPLIPEGTHHENLVYGTIDNLSPRRSPTIDSISERRSESHDNISVVSSRTSLMPNYDQASLDFRNTKATSNFQSTYDLPEPIHKPEALLSSGNNTVSPYMTSNVIANPAIASRNMPNSPIYAVPEETAEKSPPATRSPEYAVLENPNTSDSTDSRTEPNKTDKLNKPTTSENMDENLVGDVLSDSYNVNKGDDVSTKAIVTNLLDTEVPKDEPVYHVLEPTKIDNITEGSKENTQNATPHDHVYVNLVNSKENKPDNDSDGPSVAHKDEDNESCNDINYSKSQQSDVPYQHSKERTKSRADYQEILLDAIKSYPVDERNGCYVLRDSISSPGSKALTVYNKRPDSQKEFFNFKICFDDKGEVFLAKSTNKFSAIDELLDYLRSNKDLLPCTLRNQIS